VRPKHTAKVMFPVVLAATVTHVFLRSGAKPPAPGKKEALLQMFSVEVRWYMLL
jgi:hypothetical protein